MDVAIANQLAADMIDRLTLAPDFWTTMSEFDLHSGSEEYDYAVRQAVSRRIPFEDDKWRDAAAKRLGY